MIEIRALRRRGQKDEPKPLAPPPLIEGRKGAMTGNSDVVDVVHPGAAEGAIGYRKSARLYNVGLDAQAGAQPENRPGVLGDIRFVKRDPHCGPGIPRWPARSRCRQMIYATNPRGVGADCAHNVTFKARPDAKPVSTFAGRAFAGLRSYGKGANRTRPTRCPAFSGLPQPVRPAALRTSVPGSSRGRDEQ